MSKKNRRNRLFSDEQLKQIINQYNITSIADVQNVVKELTHDILQTALNAEYDETMVYRRNDQNSREISENYRNGFYDKTVKTSFGELPLEIPRDRLNKHIPIIVPKHSSDISHIEDKIISLYARGMSTRDINDTVNEIYGINVDPTMVSKITDKLLPVINEWQNRPLKPLYPIVFIDGIRFNVKENGTVNEKTVYIEIGIDTDGNKEVLGFDIAESESAKYWLKVFNDLKARGIKDILLCCSDNLKGISDAVKSVFPQTDIQKCIVHQIRNSVKFVRYDELKEFCNDMKKIYQAVNIDNAECALREFSDKYKTRYGYAVKSWNDNWHELVTFFKYPLEIRKIIYTTNIIENLNHNIRKISKAKGVFNSVDSLKKIVYLAIQNQTEKWNIRIFNWGAIITQFSILFKDRMNI